MGQLSYCSPAGLSTVVLTGYCHKGQENAGSVTGMALNLGNELALLSDVSAIPSLCS